MNMLVSFLYKQLLEHNWHTVKRGDFEHFFDFVEKFSMLQSFTAQIFLPKYRLYLGLLN